MADELLQFAKVGRLDKLLQAEREAIPRALTAVVRSRTLALKKDGRRDIIRAGLGARLANALRSAIQPPQGISLDPRGAVFSNARTKNRPGGPVDLITVFEQGATTGGPVAIPTRYCPKSKDGRKRHAQPSDFPRDLLFSRKVGSQIRLYIKGKPPVFAWVIVPNVKVPALLHLLALHKKHTAGMDAAVAKRIEQDAKRLGRAAARA